MRSEKSLREINRQSEPCNVMNRDKLELDDVTKLTTREVEDVTKLTNREMEEVPKLTTRELEDVTTVFRQFERGPREGCIDVKVGRFELFTKRDDLLHESLVRSKHQMMINLYAENMSISKKKNN